MALFVIADTHLSLGLGTDKSMDRFGARWENHAQKLAERWQKVVSPRDTVVIPGDISWAMTLEEAAADLEFLGSLPGRKLLLKGNHDYWWSSVTKMKAFLSGRGVERMDFLYNNAHAAEGYALAGSRGWFLDERQQGAFPADYEKLVRRECERLNLSLTAADALRREAGISEPALAFLHFPPVWGEFRLDPLVDVLLAHGVERCWFGHIHGQFAGEAEAFTYRGIRFANAAADALNFWPKLIGRG